MLDVQRCYIGIYFERTRTGELRSYDVIPVLAIFISSRYQDRDEA